MSTKVNGYKRGDHVRTETYPGVACWYLGECPDHYECAQVRMVGDDLTRHVSYDSLHFLDEDAFCGSCGQIGCGH